MAATLGEVVFFAALAAVGIATLFLLLASRLTSWHWLSWIPNYSFGHGLWASILVLTSFILIGLGGLIFALVQWRTTAERRSALVATAKRLRTLPEHQLPAVEALPTIPPTANLCNSPGTLLPFRLPAKRESGRPLWGWASFCLAWDIGLALFTTALANGILPKQPPWLTALLLVIMASIAAAATAYFLWQLAQAAQIGPTSVEVSDLPLYPGQRYDICVFQAGNLAIRLFAVDFVCVEQATFREGTDVRHENREVFRRRLVENKNVVLRAGEAYRQEVELMVPETAMHSFKTPSNSISWKLVVEGRAAKDKRPDALDKPTFCRSFPLLVYPLPSWRA